MSSWADMRAEWVRGFGRFPSASDEDAVRAAFAAHPVAVRSEAGRVAVRVQAGRVRDGWRVLALAVALPAQSGSDGGVLVERRTRTWIRAEGRHYPRDVVLLELERRLPHEPELRASLLTYWARLHHDTTTPGLERHEPEPPAGTHTKPERHNGTRHSHGGGADPDLRGPSRAVGS